MSRRSYKHVGKHVEDLHDGRVLAPGESVLLSDTEAKEPHNARLIAEGRLIGTGSKPIDNQIKKEVKKDGQTGS